jgi:hypothetical protein
MEGRKPNPAQGREKGLTLPLPNLNNAYDFQYSVYSISSPERGLRFLPFIGKGKKHPVNPVKILSINAGNGRTFSILTPQDGLDELQFRINWILI